MRNYLLLSGIGLALAALVFLLMFTADMPDADTQPPSANEERETPPAEASPNVPSLSPSPPPLAEWPPPEDSDYLFPAMHLIAHSHPFDMPREEWHRGAVMLSGEYGFDAAEVHIRGRGNTTWWSNPDKRPLRLRFETPRAMFGGGDAHRDWILLANHFDPSLLRNHAAFYLAAALGGMGFAPRSHFVHLYINSVYYGVYELTDERDTDPGRVELRFDADPARSEYFFEMDAHLTWVSGAGVEFFTVGRRYYDIRFPPRRDWNGHLEYLQNFVRRAGAAARSRDAEAIARYFDLDSLVDFYIVNEWMKNQDMNAYSVFMTLRGQGDARRIHFGPVWDFDHSAGNMLHHAPPEYLHAGQHHDWFSEIIQTPEIRRRVRDRWNEVRDVQIAAALTRISGMAERYAADFARNFVRHDILGTPVLPTHHEVFLLDTFEAHVDFLLRYLEARTAWLDAYFNGRTLPHSGILANRDYAGAREAYELHRITRELGRNRTASPIIMDGVKVELPYPMSNIGGRNLLPLASAVYLFGEFDAHERADVLVAADGVYVPLRAFAEEMGYEVFWHAGYNVIILRRP